MLNTYGSPDPPREGLGVLTMWSESVDTNLKSKLDTCQAILRDLVGVVVAFSGGVDSTLLLALARQTLGREKVLAALGVSPSLPQREKQAAADLARQVDVELVEIETGEFEDPEYARNPPDRCYICKSALLRRLLDLARERGLPAVVTGANADDQGDFRPGLRAGAELGVRSPLLEAGLTKQDIRDASRAMGLPTWNKPSRACLASRFPYGASLTVESVGRVERAEYVLQDLGFTQCRVRDHQALARIEVPVEELPRVLERRETIVKSLRDLGYTYITLDIAGFRSGSMNELL